MTSNPAARREHRLPRLLPVVALGLLLAGCGGEDPGVAGEALAVTIATTPRHQAVPVADPYRARFPGNTVEQNFARSIWDMHTFEGRIYVGAGDYWANSGAADVWSIGDDGVTTDVQLELTVDDEMVDRFHAAGGTLFIPGKDATEGWELGNFYYKRDGAWHKQRTIPNALHVYDLAVFQGNLYVNMRDERRGSVLESTDAGLTWHGLAKRPPSGMLAPLANELLILGESGSLWSYSAQGLKDYRGTKLLPAAAAFGPTRVTPFGNGVLYVAAFLPMLDEPAPLLYLPYPYRGYVALTKLAGETVANVRDLVVEDGTAYALAARRDGANPSAPFVGQIFASTDAATWTKVAEFEVPAPPYSLARLGGRFYVGLGNEGWKLTDTTLEPQSGTIWRIE